MVNSFKNFERLRYRISTDIKKIVIDSKSNSEGMKEEISSTVFSTVFSAFLTEIAFNSNKDTFNGCEVIALIILFIIIYASSYYLYKLGFCRIAVFIRNRRIHTIDKDMETMIQIQKDFDNIACDSILVAKDYKLEYQRLDNNESNKNFKIFYYYEIMHYLATACEKTTDLVNNKENCIRTLSEAEGVDVFRVINIINIMQELDQFLDDNFGLLNDHNVQKDAVSYQHNQIKTMIRYIADNV